jgi:transcriptional pleiotropic regulator of transition state genes
MTKKAGIVRKVDRLGRILPPIELRKALDISIGDLVSLNLEDDVIILRKYNAKRQCAITGEILDEDAEFEEFNGLLLSPKGSALLLEELQQHIKK